MNYGLHDLIKAYQIRLSIKVVRSSKFRSLHTCLNLPHFHCLHVWQITASQFSSYPIITWNWCMVQVSYKKDHGSWLIQFQETYHFSQIDFVNSSIIRTAKWWWSFVNLKSCQQYECVFRNIFQLLKTIKNFHKIKNKFKLNLNHRLVSIKIS